MAVSESHTIKISGRMTLKDLENLVAKAKAAGAPDDARIQVTQASGNQRDETPASITVVIAGFGL